MKPELIYTDSFKGVGKVFGAHESVRSSGKLWIIQQARYNSVKPGYSRARERERERAVSSANFRQKFLTHNTITYNFVASIHRTSGGDVYGFLYCPIGCGLPSPDSWPT